MIEETLKSYLESELGMQAYIQAPEDIFDTAGTIDTSVPDSYLLVEKTGSSRDASRTVSCSVSVDSIAPSLYEAAVLNEKVKAVMDVMADKTNVSACRLDSDYPFNDTVMKKYRYTATFNITE